MTQISDIPQQDFEQEVLNHSGPVLVDFWAPWCGPCRALAPVLEQLSESLPEVKIVKINIDDNGDLASAAGIRSIPTVMLFSDGKLQQTLMGVQPVDSYRTAIASLDSDQPTPAATA